jgi:VanZ family protein
LLVAYTIFVFTIGVIEIGPLPIAPAVPSDKLGHAAAFGVYAWVIELALLELSPGVRRLLSVLASAAAGLLLELIQSALPHRSAEVLDFLADAVGALFAALASALLARIALRSPNAPERVS